VGRADLAAVAVEEARFLALALDPHLRAVGRDEVRPARAEVKLRQRVTFAADEHRLAHFDAVVLLGSHAASRPGHQAPWQDLWRHGSPMAFGCSPCPQSS
jgi:hypothetical protein